MSRPQPLGEDEKWMVVGDRYFEIGLFAVFDEKFKKSASSVFCGLDEKELLDRFFNILRINKVAGWSELEKWKAD